MRRNLPETKVGIALGIAGAWQRAISHHQTALTIYQELYNAYNEAIVLHNMNFVKLKLQSSYEIIEDFQRALSTFEKLDDRRWINYCKSSIGEALLLLERWTDAQNYIQADDQYDATTRIRNHKLQGDLQRHEKRWNKAINFYKQALELATIQGRQRDRAEIIVRICACLFNLKRQKSIPDYVSSILTILQQQKAYNYLSQFYLILGHYAFKDPVANNSQYILEMYQRCLEYALCYNKYLLDDVLAHQSHYMPLVPIIPFCMRHGESGREILLALRNWWQFDSLKIVDLSHLLIPDKLTDKSLVAVERVIRSQEPENGSPQIFVIEQIEQAI